MEEKQTKSRGKLLSLDPRSKLLILALFSVIIMIDVVSGPAYIVRIIMTFVPVVLVCLEGKPHIGIRFSLLFILASFLQGYAQQHISGVLGMIILFICYMVTQFAPTIMMVWYCISTTKISEFMAAMGRMHAPPGLSISIAVMMRFFPTLAEEYRFIQDAMKMRGIGLGGGNPVKMVEYRIIPLLFSAMNIGDELSAAAVTRGLGAPVKRTGVCEIGFGAQDYVTVTFVAVLTALFLLCQSL